MCFNRYWIYNDGKFQTVLYKAKSDPLQKLSSPTVTPADCTANVPRGIQCTVTIPPIKEPFQVMNDLIFGFKLCLSVIFWV